METILDALVRASWQGGIAIIAVWGLCRLLPRLPAAIRCTLWRLTYIKLLLSLVVAGAVLLPVLPPINAPNVTPVVAGASPGIAAPIGIHASPSSLRGRVAPSPVPPSPSPPPISPTLILITLYGVGLAAGGVSLFRAWRRTQNLLHGAVPASDDRLPSICKELAERLNLSRLPTLRTTEAIASPLLVGVLRETVLLPHTWVTTAIPAEIRLALAHELAHSRRRDLAWEWLGTLTQVVFWFNPLVWLARREERTAREMACDAIALSITGEPASLYSRLLFQIAALPAQGRTVSVGALGSGEKGRLLLMRITELNGVMPSPRYIWFGVLAGGCALLMTGIPWRFVARPTVGQTITEERIAGVVTTPEGKPVPGVAVSWITTRERERRTESLVCATTTTDSQGRYQFDRKPDSPTMTLGGIKRPAGIIMAQAKGWGLSFSANLMAYPQSASITLQPPVVHEVVYHNEQGKPLANIPLQATVLYLDDFIVYLNDLNLPNYQGATDTEGRFRVVGVPRNNSLQFAPMTREWAADTGKTVAVPEGHRTRHTLYPAGKIVGVVEGIPHPITKGVASDSISVWYQRFDKKRNQEVEHQKAVAASRNGQYEIAGLLPGSYRVWVEPSDRAVVADYYPEVTVRAGETVRCGFRTKQGLLLQGQVTDEETRKPIPDAEVGAAHLRDSLSDPPYLTTTDSEGRYRLRVPYGGVRMVVREGENTLVGIHPYDEKRKMILGETADLTEMTVNLAMKTLPKLKLQGSVFGPDGRKLRVAVVEFHSANLHGGALVSSVGTFFASCSGNKVTFPVHLLAHNGDLSAAMVIEKGDPGPLNLRLTARPRPVLRGFVVDRQGKAVVGAQVQVNKAPLNVMQKTKDYTAFETLHISYPPEYTTTDAQGQFKVVGWPDFSYRFRVDSGALSKTVPPGTENGVMTYQEQVKPLKIVLP